MRIRRIGRSALLVLLATQTGSEAAPAETIPVELEVRARQIAPGEPIRVVTLSPRPLESLRGRFLGESVFMTRVGPSGHGELWAGWSMIALDEPSGVAAIEVLGTADNGQLVSGTRAVTIEPKAFPEERLSVAPRFVKPPREVEQRLARERERLAAIYRSRAATPAAFGAAFLRPVPGEPTSIFGMRRIYNGEPRSPHPGLDLRAATGTPVSSSGPGRVVLAEELYYSGQTVVLDHGGGLFTLYAHLSEILVEVGQATGAGDLIGRSGATGRVTGPHLHWGAKIGDRPFDPTALLDEALFH